MVHCDKPRRENYPWDETEAKVLSHLRSDLGENSKVWKWLQRLILGFLRPQIGDD